MAAVEKTISYRRAQWHRSAEEGDHLEAIMKKVYKKLNKSNKRTVERDKKRFKCGKPHELTGGGLLLHYTADTPGEFASVVKNAHDEDEDIATQEMEPLENSEFLDSEAFVLIVGDNVFICVSGLREQAVRFILAKSIEKAGFSNDATAFEMRAAANVEKVDMINRDGVEEVDLRMAMYSASLRHAERVQTTGGVKRGIARLFQALAGYEDAPEEDNLIVHVALKADGRMKTGVASGQERITAIASQVIQTADDDDSFRIKTRSGAQISQNEVYIRGAASIEKSGKSLVRQSVWNELTAFYEGLKSNGSMER